MIWDHDAAGSSPVIQIQERVISFGGGSFCYVVLAELVLHLIANQRSSFTRCIGSSPIYYAHAVCPIGRGCCLENSLDVKVFGVRIPNTAYTPIFWQE